MVEARMKLNKYTNKVLNVVKAKYELKDKSEALNKFVQIHGWQETEPEVRDEFVEEVIQIMKRHKEKHDNRTMTIKEVKKLLEEDD